ncbi:hypothetical protein [Clostridium sp.]|uniref:hypothetical protein n=1 Tax=Clostridium sp. TaxID=1506 RepID=UPI002603FC74|nr:hypothetical protein [Clostridium sp.]
MHKWVKEPIYAFLNLMKIKKRIYTDNKRIYDVSRIHHTLSSEGWHNRKGIVGKYYMDSTILIYL